MMMMIPSGEEGCFSFVFRRLFIFPRYPFCRSFFAGALHAGGGRFRISTIGVSVCIEWRRARSFMLYWADNIVVDIKSD